MTIQTLELHESQVRTYCRQFPVQFDKAEGSHVYDTAGNRYLDFLAGAGSLNYGHNNPVIRDALVDYLQDGRIVQSLDLFTVAKADFVKTFYANVLQPRGLGDFKIQFVGPTGTNSVEAALKLARRVTRRTEVFAFTNGFHGVTLGALAACGEQGKRAAGGVPLTHVTRVPFDGYKGAGNTLDIVEKMLDDPSSGWTPPAAFIVEVVQGEGGLNVASASWLQALRKLCDRVGSLLIIDEIQSGCGRTGDFFAFEQSGIKPDLICVSKSLGGYGLPMAVLLMRPEHDCWKPGEHNGTFRGSCLSFVAATQALKTYWSDPAFAKRVHQKSMMAKARLNALTSTHRGVTTVGRGLMLGLRFATPADATEIMLDCFTDRLIVETCGPNSNTLKMLPPLTTPMETLLDGLEIVANATSRVLRKRSVPKPVRMPELAAV